MPFNANNFRSTLKYGGARPNMFEIILVNPPAAFTNLQINASGRGGAGSRGTSTSPDGANGNALNTFTFMCNSADMPGSIIGTIPVAYFGRFINVAGDRMYDDWNCTLYTDEDMITRNSFEAWNSSMAYHNYDTNKEHGDAGKLVNNYVCDVWVQHYTKTGKIDKIYILKNAFPYVVSPVQMSWQANDQIMMFQVTWKYDYFITSFKTFKDQGDMTVADAEADNKEA